MSRLIYIYGVSEAPRPGLQGDLSGWLLAFDDIKLIYRLQGYSSVQRRTFVDMKLRVA